MDRKSTFRIWLLFALLCVPMAPLSAQEAAVDADDSTAAEVAQPANNVEASQLPATAAAERWYRRLSLALRPALGPGEDIHIEVIKAMEEGRRSDATEALERDLRHTSRLVIEHYPSETAGTG